MENPSMKSARIWSRLAGAILAALMVVAPVSCSRQGHPPGALPSDGQSASSRAATFEFLPHPAFALASSGKSVSIADIVERALPSVVSISSTKVTHSAGPQMPFFNDPFFRHFFGPGGEVPRDRLEQGLGSGVIVSADGVILTNHHVVAQADDIQVVTPDRRQFAAKVVGSDPKSDLAVIKLEGKVEGLKPIAFGDSARLRLGDVVLAIGNPFGLSQTVTMGIVSATGRANVGITDYEDFIQTDAAINPGNSGGALINMEGDLVGINTAILSRTGGSQGIGFAIPSNMAKPIADSLLEYGKVARGWLGVVIQDIDQELAKALGLGTTQGVLISDVAEGGPAAKAGLKRGDVVLSVGGKATNSTGSLRNLIAASGAKAKVKLDVLREGKKTTLTVDLGELPTETAQPGSKPSGEVLAGLVVEDMSHSARQRFKIPSSIKQGVVIVRVEPGSAAAKVNLRPGDVILELNRSKVTGAAAVEHVLKKAKGNVLLLVAREGTTQYVVLPLK
jgi:serine protease Do